jgi:hypothetical protein
MPMPKVFVSYSWDDDDHKRWVRDLATRLRQDGIEALLDQWHLVPGDQLPAFMETSVRESDFALIICTPRYKERSDSRAGGVGYEGDIMTGELYNARNTRKFIPLLARGTWSAAAPSWLQGKYHLDFGNTPPDETPYHDLVMTILGRRLQAPPVGQTGLFTSAPSVAVEALFLNQDTITLNPVSIDPERGYSSFVWPATYELHNTGDRGVTINKIENVLSGVRIDAHELLLESIDASKRVIVTYESFQALTGDSPQSVCERLPYTLKPWTKMYMKVMGNYRVTDRGMLLFSKEKEEGYNLLTLALGASLNPDGSRPGVVKKFKTVVEFAGYGSVSSDQRAILLTPGCKIDVDALLDRTLVPGKRS